MSKPPHGVAAAGELPHRKIAVVSCLVALFLLQAMFRFQSELNHDTAWYLHVAGGLLDGKRLYHDFIEVNPPLGIWLTVPVVAAARLTGADAIYLTYAVFFALTAASLGLVSRYLCKLPGLTFSQRNMLLIAIATFTLFVPARDFAQREHLLILLFLPWLFLRVVRTAGGTVAPLEASLAGIIAAAGICLKPHSVLAPLFAEIAVLVLSRNFRLVVAPENLAAVGFVAVYAAITTVASPEFFSGMVELGLRAYVPFYGHAPAIILQGSARSAIAAGTTMILLPFVGGVWRRLTIICLAAGAGLLVSYYLQTKGFRYQVLPADILFGMALASAILGSFDAIAQTKARFAVFAGALVLFSQLFFNAGRQFYPYHGATFASAIAKFRPDAKSFFIASTNVTPGFPLTLKVHRAWASRLPSQWLAPYVAARWQDGPLPADPIVAYALDLTVSDLQNYRPDIIFVDRRREQSYFTDRPLDYVKFWMHDARFAAIWRDYEIRDAPGDYDIYVRKAQ